MSEQDLVAAIRGEVTPSAQMILGQAWGEVLEQPTKYAVSDGLGGIAGYQHISERGDRPVPTHFFSADTIAPAIALFDYEHGLFEVKSQRTYPGGIDVVAKVDYICGSLIGENKTSDRIDFDKYFASCQWRFYLDVFEAAAVTYNVFQLGVDRDNVVNLKDTIRFTLYPYAALHAECCALVEEFADYVRRKGLDRVLLARQRDAAWTPGGRP